ncbi:hypothetical protein HanOQP8_Chr11g0418351 [Helianthus annuus]|nr:hypothetical protein HanLR1_Chr11g0417401 [Helianthus annuus]KAJ0690484.1 hypothetical protein HanOQP8_Chr11g0418351 [Helianthus annuus]
MPFYSYIHICFLIVEASAAHLRFYSPLHYKSSPAAFLKRITKEKKSKLEIMRKDIDSQRQNLEAMM